MVVDLAVVGGGCAGLSLARALAQDGIKQSVIVIEPRTHYGNDRSWCFWAPDTQDAPKDLPLIPLPAQIWRTVHHRWPSWAFGQMNQPVATKQSPGLSYQYLRASDFYQVCRQTIEASATVDLHLGQTVQMITPVAAGWEITTDKQVVQARHVIDTRGPDRERASKASLQQVFLGAEIELDVPAEIDIGLAELMTDMRLVNGEFCFTYVLPYSPTRLLVEVTFFARVVPDRAVLEAELESLLQRRGWGQAQVVRQEYAVLPMGLPSARVLPGQPPQAGTGGGALRASSGYGFLRIQRWAANCAQHYLATGEVVGHPKPHWWWRSMDQLFLDVIVSDPSLAPVIFERMLKRTEPARFVRFMSDQASVMDCVRIIAGLPKRPFLTALLNRALGYMGVSR